MLQTNSDSYSLPKYGIGPFNGKGIVQYLHLSNSMNIDSCVLDNYLSERFEEKFTYTLNGREAINIALRSYDLDKSDLVTILTTSQSFYISGCVTKEIEKFCNWNRAIVPETKIIFVNHEFGYIYPDMDYLVSLGLPIIEDCCTTFFSQDAAGKVGKYGDFAVYSFPKFFPVQIGGMLVSNEGKTLNGIPSIEANTKIHLQRVLGHCILMLDELLYKRKTNFDYGLEQFSQLGFSERFEKQFLTVPSAMMLKNNGIVKDLPALKTALWNHGIESSVFYGEDAFFIPSHQNLTKTDLNYFFEVLKSFIQKSP